MTNASLTELRQHAREYFDKVENGETVRVFRHGKPIAEVVPVGARKKNPFANMPALRLRIPGVSLSSEILKDREAGR